MKIRARELRQVIREEFMRGVPEFALRKASQDCVDQLRDSIKRFILLRSENPAQQRQMIAAAAPVLEELEEKIYADIEDKLYQFLQQV